MLGVRIYVDMLRVCARGGVAVDDVGREDQRDAHVFIDSLVIWFRIQEQTRGVFH